MATTTDNELAIYRDLLKPPTEFKDGFGWSTVIGILFCGLVMLPGSIYLGLMTGGSMGSAATWVTVILFNEIARRALKSLPKQQLVVLLHAAGSMIGGGLIGQLVTRAFMVSSDPIRDAGMRGHFPAWYAPSPDSPAIVQRNLFHHDWWIPIGLILFMTVIGLAKRYALGYFFFRLCSDIEKLPFPMAPISAQGSLAMSEADESEPVDPSVNPLKPNSGAKKKKSNLWRFFSLGVFFGVVFGFVQVGIPAISSLFLDKPLFIIPQPWIETTPLTEVILPATPTGVVFDLGIILMGMLVPFWAVIGTFLAILLTIVANPVLHHYGILSRWQPGMDTVNTSFSNSIDFWMSFGIGVGLAIAAVSIFSTIRDVRSRMKDMKERPDSGHTPLSEMWKTPNLGRGDYPMWIALAIYVFAASTVVFVCYLLLPRNFGILLFLIFFSFIYNPLISYVNARLLGIAGQSVDIPFVKETSFILSGAKGIEIWLAPIPVENYGGLAQSFRVNELTGVSFASLIKTDLVVLPASFILSMVFWGFIWASGPIPSSSFPSAQVQWELAAKNSALLYSSTFSADPSQPSNIMNSEFMQAIHPSVIGIGAAVTIVVFSTLAGLGLPSMLFYGFIRGVGGLPHTMILEIVGALIGRYYFQKKYGAKAFLLAAPTVLAGYYTGVGLIGMGTIAMRLIQQAVSGAPF